MFDRLRCVEAKKESIEKKDYFKIILVMKFRILNSDFYPNSNGLASNQNSILTFEFPFALVSP